jgi:hypothetical protein
MATEKGTARSAGFAPCFPVRDIRAALAHYERLGFDVMPVTGATRWAWARLGTAELHLFQKDDHDPATTAAAADLAIENADEFGRRLAATGVAGTSQPCDTRYGREVVHVDPDNNLLRFVAPLQPASKGPAARPAAAATAGSPSLPAHRPGLRPVHALTAFARASPRLVAGIVTALVMVAALILVITLFPSSHKNDQPPGRPPASPATP